MHAAKQAAVVPVGEDGEVGGMGTVGKVAKRIRRRVTRRVRSFKAIGVASITGGLAGGLKMAESNSVDSDLGGKKGREGWFLPRRLLYGASEGEPYDVDTGIRLVSFASLAWSVTHLSPMIFEALKM